MPNYPTTELHPRRGVLSLSGYGLRIAVERGHLSVTDGAGTSRRQGRFSRVAPDLKRLIIQGTSGTLTLDALSWLESTGAHVVQLDHDGRLVVVTATARLDDARLRRAQAMALTSGLALDMARELIAAKIAGQADTLSAVPNAGPIANALRDALPHVHAARTLDRVRYVEARAANAYWHAWASVELRFPEKQLARIPRHWTALGNRHSPLTYSARRAVSPVNAILNYCYGIAAAEARIAVVSAGCDPGLGILHADRQGRDSFALDVLEPIRPHVDAYVLRLLREHTFTRDDFFENLQGVCRIMPPLAHRLSETASQWAKLAQPIAHRAARRFERAGAAGSEERSAVSRELAAERVSSQLPAALRARRQPGAPVTEASDRRCRRCDAAIGGKRRQYCAACVETVPAMASQHAVRALRRRQREELGAGPSAETRQLLGDARSPRSAEMRAWEAAHPSIPAPYLFAKDILPGLASVRAQEVHDVTGLSISYCRRVLRGQYIPHAMHWGKLRKLAGTGRHRVR